MRRGRLISGAVLVLVVVAVASIYWRGRGDSPVSDIPPSAIYARVARALAQPGMIAVVRVERNQAARSPQQSTTMWIDAGHDLARVETETDYGAFGRSLTRRILRDGNEYTVYSENNQTAKTPNRGCPEAELRALSAIAGCYGFVPGENNSLRTHVEEDRTYDGRWAVSLVTKGSYSGIDSTVSVNNVLYVDAETNLPLALRVRGKDKMLGHTTGFESETRYSIEFVAAESVPADFFAPAAIGYVEPNPEQPLIDQDPGIVLYWLGKEFAGTDSLPALSLGEVRLSEHGPSASSDVTLAYRPASDDFAAPVLTMTNWSAAGWASFVGTGAPPPWRRDPCVATDTISTPAGSATFYEYPLEEGSCGPPYVFTAEVETGDTVVVVSSGAYHALNGLDNPYASRFGLEHVVRGLTLRP